MVAGKRTLDLNGWRVAAGLHESAEEDGYVAVGIFGLASSSVMVLKAALRYVALFEDR